MRILTDMEIRILGCLIEKESTTPDYYPLTLNGLVNACNQKSNRNPVVDYSDSEVSDVLRKLQGEKLVIIASGSGQRVRKYLHKFKDTYFVDKKEQAILAVLMLRGPQTLGELRTRTERIYAFESIAEVEETLAELADREHPLAIQLPRQAGQKDSRYMHLLAGEIDLSEMQTFEVQKDSSKSASKVEKLEAEVAELRTELDALKNQFAEFKRQFE